MKIEDTYMHVMKIYKERKREMKKICPLEIINKKFLVFTTTDPDNRYVRYKNIAAHNNLRDVYIRDIALSDFIKSAEISYGVRKAKG